jgi:hypothetical protein
MAELTVKMINASRRDLQRGIRAKAEIDGKHMQKFSLDLVDSLVLGPPGKSQPTKWGI